MRIKIFILIVLLNFCGNLLAEERETFTEALSKTFKGAMRDVDQEKANEKIEQEKYAGVKLSSFIDGWIKAQQVKRKNELTTIIEQKWEDSIDIGQPYRDYYLRDFAYRIQSKDIADTSLITFPYKAAIIIKELLYVEQAPLIAEPREDYQYSADTDISINLQYDKSAGEWQIIDTQQHFIGLRKGWPEDIKRKVGRYFIPPI